MELEEGDFTEKKFSAIEKFLLGIRGGGREIVSERIYLVREEETMLAVKVAKDPQLIGENMADSKLFSLCKYLVNKSVYCAHKKYH